jgi:hypothetical protein
MFLAARFHIREVLLAGQLAARDGENAGIRGDLTCGHPPEERGQELAHGEIASAAEKNEIERVVFLHGSAKVS